MGSDSYSTSEDEVYQDDKQKANALENMLRKELMEEDSHSRTTSEQVTYLDDVADDHHDNRRDDDELEIILSSESKQHYDVEDVPYETYDRDEVDDQYEDEDEVKYGRKTYDDETQSYEGGQYMDNHNHNHQHGNNEGGYENPIAPDWRALQQDYLANRGVKGSNNGRASSRARDQSPYAEQRAITNGERSGSRLYNHAIEMRRKKDMRCRKKKEEEEKIKPKLELVTQRGKTDRNARSSSTPRCLHLYDQGKALDRRKKVAQEKDEKQFQEKNKLQLVSRSSSRARQSSSVPRHIHLYEKAKLKRMKQQKAENAKEKEKVVVRKNVNTPQRINRLYEMSKSTQKEGKLRREQIEKQKKMEKKPQRSASVSSRRGYTEPLDIALYDRGMAKKRVLELKRAKAAAERYDDKYKKSPLLNN